MATGRYDDCGSGRYDNRAGRGPWAIIVWVRTGVVGIKPVAVIVTIVSAMVDVFSVDVGVRRGGADGKECGGYQSEEDIRGGLHFFDVLCSTDLVSATLVGAGSLISLTWFRCWLFNWMQ
jgi:hypothetical protein